MTSHGQHVDFSGYSQEKKYTFAKHFDLVTSGIGKHVVVHY